MSKAKTSNFQIAQFFPIVNWLKNYTHQDFDGDIFAGIITAILLVPQGIAYAILAGLPPQMGLYASILPTAVYTLLGTSRPHIAVVGRVPKTDIYRNIARHAVETWHHLLLVRIDESHLFQH